jgi:hypothetical protein
MIFRTLKDIVRLFEKMGVKENVVVKGSFKDNSGKTIMTHDISLNISKIENDQPTEIEISLKDSVASSE